MDTCFALYKAHFAGTYPFSYSLEELADYYTAFDRLMAHWKTVLPAAAFMEVAYEDIIADQPGQSRRILDFLGLPWEDEILMFHQSQNPATTASAVQVRRPIYEAFVTASGATHADETGTAQNATDEASVETTVTRDRLPRMTGKFA